MKKIDIHSHILNIDVDTEVYADKLAASCGESGIEKICLMGLPEYFRFSSNSDLLLAMKKYPDLMVGFAAIDLRRDHPEKLELYKKQGFSGFKFITPPSDYDDNQFYKFYEKAADLQMPMLFHLGIVARKDYMRAEDVNSNRMRPIHLDAIARAFPEATIIGAHLGNPWYEEASMAARWNPNLWFDLSGSTLKKKSPEDLAKLLWWKQDEQYAGPANQGAWDSICFGSDVAHDKIQEVVEDYQRIFDALDLSRQTQEDVFFNNAAKLLNIA